MSDPEIKAEVILGSLHPDTGTPLYTWKLQYPYIIHAQLLMHRTFSRSFMSNRAIPTKKWVERVMESPFIPEMSYNCKGMQPSQELSDEDQASAEMIIQSMLNFSILGVTQLAKLGVHKQWVNRYLTPFMYFEGIYTTQPTGLQNFFDLRSLDNGEQKEIKELAVKMKEAAAAYTPRVVPFGEYHIPYILPEEEGLDTCVKLKVSSARIARISYAKHGTDKIDLIEDMRLSNDLQEKKHMNPFEHQATPVWEPHSKGTLGQDCWLQYRSIIEDES